MRRIILATVFAALTASALVPAQRGGTMTAEQMEQRWELERELQSLAVVERKVMMPMRDGVRLATDIYRPKNATGKVPTIFVKTPYNFNFWDVRNGVPCRHDRGADRGQARLRLRRAERARALLLRRELRHPRRRRSPTATTRWTWIVEAAVVERQGRHDRLLVDRRISAGGRGAGASRVRRDERAGLRRRRRPRRPVLRAGQLVSRRRGADALHRLALRPAEPGAADVPAEHVAGGSDSRVAACSTSRRRCRRSTGRRRSRICRCRTS